MSKSILPKTEELQKSELKVWVYIFEKLTEFEKRITALEKKSDE